MKALICAKLLKDPPAAPAGQDSLWVADTRLPGFCVDIRTRVSTFWFRWKDEERKRRQTKLGRHGTDLTIDQARRLAAEMRTKVATGKVPVEDRRRSLQTFAEFVEGQFTPHKLLRKREESWAEDLRMLRQRILPAFGGRRLTSVTTGDVQQFHNSIVTGGCTRSTANRFLALTKHIFSLAQLWDQIDRDPARAVKLFSEPPGRERFLTETEIAALVAALRDELDRVGAAASLFLLLTGARRGEVLKARWADIDLGQRSWRLPMTKSGRPLVRRLSGAAADLLATLPRAGADAPVFPHPRTGGHRRCVQKLWDRTCDTAGISDCRLHDLRHTFATLLANSNISQNTIQRMLGHSTPAMTARYSHATSGALVDAANIVATLVTAAVAQAPGDETLLHRVGPETVG